MDERMEVTLIDGTWVITAVKGGRFTQIGYDPENEVYVPWRRGGQPDQQAREAKAVLAAAAGAAKSG